MAWITTRNTFITTTEDLPFRSGQERPARPRLQSSPSILLEIDSDCDTVTTSESVYNFFESADVTHVTGCFEFKSRKHVVAVLGNLPRNVTLVDIHEIVKTVLHDVRICHIEIYPGPDSKSSSTMAILKLHPDALPMSLFLNLHGHELNGYKIEAYLHMPSINTTLGTVGDQTVSRRTLIKMFRQHQSREGIQHSRKLFIGGLPASVDSVTLRSYFMRFGRIKNCGVVRDFKGVSRKFGFCEFYCDSAFHTAINMTEHMIGGTVVGVRPYCIRPEPEIA